MRNWNHCKFNHFTGGKYVETFKQNELSGKLSLMSFFYVHVQLNLVGEVVWFDLCEQTTRPLRNLLPVVSYMGTSINVIVMLSRATVISWNWNQFIPVWHELFIGSFLFPFIARKHSSRMRTAHFCGSMFLTGGVGLVSGRSGPERGMMWLPVWSLVPSRREVWAHESSGALGVWSPGGREMALHPPWCKNSTFPQLRLQALPKIAGI